MSVSNPNKLSVCWSERHNYWVIKYPRSCDGHLLDAILRKLEERPLFDAAITGIESLPPLMELEKRGYDLKTFRMEISMKEIDNDQV